jgi:dsRNA-specific ribonuclease
MVATAMESVLGAVFIHGGMEALEAVMKKFGIDHETLVEKEAAEEMAPDAEGMQDQDTVGSLPV